MLYSLPLILCSLQGHSSRTAETRKLKIVYKYDLDTTKAFSSLSSNLVRCEVKMEVDVNCYYSTQGRTLTLVITMVSIPKKSNPSFTRL